MSTGTYRGKLVIVGDPAVGKTALWNMYTKDGNDFPKSYNMTFAADVASKRIFIPDTEDSVELLIYDSPSFEFYTDLLDKFWKSPDLLLIVYDTTNTKSLETVSLWYEVCRQVQWRDSSNMPVAMALFGNKIDLEHRRCVTEIEALHVAERFHMKHFIGSAKNNQGLQEPFRYLANSFYKHEVKGQK